MLEYFNRNNNNSNSGNEWLQQQRNFINIKFPKFIQWASTPSSRYRAMISESRKENGNKG